MQRVDGLPLGSCSVGIAEVGEETVEICVVVIRDVREGRLIRAVACRLVDAPDELLEGLQDVVANSAFLQTDIGGGSHIVKMIVPLLAELRDDIVVQHNEVFAEGNGTLTLGREKEGKVRYLSGERLQVIWRARCDTIDVAHAISHQGIKADGHAVLLQHGS